MKCDICGEVNDAVEIHMCKQCANKFSDNVNCIKRDLAIYKRALELACDGIRDMYCSDYCICTRDERCKGKCCYEKYYNKEQFLDQAKKEMEECKDGFEN